MESAQNDQNENNSSAGVQLATESDAIEHDHRCSNACAASEAHMRAMEADADRQLAQLEDDEPARCSHGAIAELCPVCSKPDEPADDLGTYADMFAKYLHEQRHWIGAAQQPLVFHVRKLCRRLDTDPDAPASYASAYLQAISRLDKQRPGNTQPAGAAGDLPGQGSIFDELD